MPSLCTGFTVSSDILLACLRQQPDATLDELRLALTTSGSVNGAVTGEVFTVYLDQVLGPCLRPGDARQSGRLLGERYG